MGGGISSFESMLWAGERTRAHLGAIRGYRSADDICDIGIFFTEPGMKAGCETQ